MNDSTTRAMPGLWAVLPAAGQGRRFGVERPKQYLRIGGRLVIDWTLERLLSVPRIQALVLVLNERDCHWEDSEFAEDPRIHRVAGGQERIDSVEAGLVTVQEQAGSGAWALVHDVARPCVTLDDIQRLISEVAWSPDGGLLASPVRDTMKRAHCDGRIDQTIDRSGLWHALTPQLFPVDALVQALEMTRAAGIETTDEASAMEHCHHRPRLVAGAATNIKLTYPEDLPLVSAILRAQRFESVQGARASVRHPGR